MTRQLKKRCYRKHIIAVVPQLLKLLMALIKEKKAYVFREEAVAQMKKLEEKYTDMRNKDKKMKEAA